ncbi:Protein of unknown function [Pyronema omphalodes CBS 100304]|uniref:Uncharacterized protein n=1 Tax=Pyronema omphalodes (strain CBS 100304) TaxID=1076935 RepID=U4L7Z4_PYROM|nr:Protein of unknown function [Pyronema omphalodes CBS 100304]
MLIYIENTITIKRLLLKLASTFHSQDFANFSLSSPAAIQDLRKDLPSPCLASIPSSVSHVPDV